MKIKKCVRFRFSIFNFFTGAARPTIRFFGSARLVRNANGGHELIGGTPADHAAARQWCSLFAPEVVFSSAEMRVWTDPVPWPARQTCVS